jgi:phosphoribosylformylglycinamidine cyclo-ligase
LDYYATGRLVPEDACRIVSGIAEGCRRGECALVGGETAEMPGMYAGDDFDLAGFAVGIAERDEMNRSEKVQKGQVVLAVPSSGIHSNGYSLVRKLFFEKLAMDFDDEFAGTTLIETLLEPTRIYVKEFKKHKDRIVALAHITGGGVVENLPRVLPKGLGADIEVSRIETLPVFEFMQRYIDKKEMFRTFNMGIGMTWVVEEESVDTIVSQTDAYPIGRITDGHEGVDLLG